MPRVSDEQALACCEMPSLVVASKQDFARDLVDARDTRNQALAERDEARCALSAACARLADVLNLTLPSHYDPVDAIAADIVRLLDVERLWIEACRIARACCPVRDGESHVRDGIPRLSDSLADARRERDEARAECDDLHRALDVLRDECARLRVIEQAALYVLNAQDEGDLLDAERRVVEAFRSDATKPFKEKQ